MPRPWEADPSALFTHRLGKSAAELGNTDGKTGCPDIWQLDNGDVAVMAAISRPRTRPACRRASPSPRTKGWWSSPATCSARRKKTSRMPDLHALRLPLLDPARGTRLDLDAYEEDFWRRYTQIQGRDSWKLERGQHFVEQNSPSREALARGDWEGAIRLLENRRESLRKEGEQDRRQRTVFHRVRVVQRPFTPYIHWELHSLRLNAEYGEAIRIVDATRIAGPEESFGPLPELVVVGGRTLYQVIYTAEGVLDGGVRFTDPDLVQGWEGVIRAISEDGEDLAPYFERAVAPLPPPRLTTE